jgi:hypothetical protein
MWIDMWMDVRTYVGKYIHTTLTSEFTDLHKLNQVKNVFGHRKCLRPKNRGVESQWGVCVCSFV